MESIAMSICQREKADLLHAKMLREHEKRLIGMLPGESEAGRPQLARRPTCSIWPEHAVTHRISTHGPRFTNPYDVVTYDLEALLREWHL